MKTFFRTTGIILVVIVAILFAAPFLFKGKIIAVVKSQINQRVNARVEFADVNVSLLRHFPRLSASVEDIRITGNGRFADDTLLSAQNIDVALNLMSVIRGNRMTIYSVTVQRPRIHAIVGRDGKANWDIMKPDTATASSEESKPFNVELKRYSIEDGFVSYIDSSSNMSSTVEGLNHEGSGDFTADQFTLSTKTTADRVNYTYGVIPYLSNTRTSIDADIVVNNKTSTYTFKTDKVLLNELQLAADGFFQMPDDGSYNMDIRFNAPSTDFKNILSLVPIIYQKDFARVKTGGKAVFNGFVKGRYSEKQLPAYGLQLDVANGFFQYPDLPAPVKNINVAMKVSNPDGVTDHTVVDISRAHLEMENDPFDFRLLLRTPVSDMWVDAAAKGTLNLGKVGRMVKLEKGTTLSGLLNADLSLKGFVEAVEKQQFDRFTAAGSIGLDRFAYASKDYPDGVQLDRLAMTFNPKNVTLREAAGKYLGTGFQANGEINNLLPYVLKNHPLDGTINVKADRVDVNRFMGTPGSDKSDTGSAPFVVPANLNMVVNAQAGAVKYDNLTFQSVSGALHVGDETVKLDNVKGNALDGTIAVSGSYSTRQNKKHPAIALRYDVQNLDVQKTFTTFVTVQKLMPIAKFLGGKLSSSLNLTGNLGSNMLPELTTLTGNGNLFLIEGLLQKFKPLEALADRLNLEQLKDISLREIREEFQFNAGKVFVKPFKVKVQNIEMEIGGMHGFDQSLDYTIQLRIPRSMLGTKGNQLITGLASQASARGVPIKLSDVVNVNVRMLGTISNPDLRFDLRQTANGIAGDIKDQAKDFVKARIDSTTRTVRDTLQSLKSTAIREASDALKQQLFGKHDSTHVADTTKKGAQNAADRLKETGKGLIDGLSPFRKKK